jgi:uncharacterized membrane protein YwaF
MVWSIQYVYNKTKAARYIRLVMKCLSSNIWRLNMNGCTSHLSCHVRLSSAAAVLCVSLMFDRHVQWEKLTAWWSCTLSIFTIFTYITVKLLAKLVFYTCKIQHKYNKLNWTCQICHQICVYCGNVDYEKNTCYNFASAIIDIYQ